MKNLQEGFLCAYSSWLFELFGKIRAMFLNLKQSILNRSITRALFVGKCVTGVKIGMKEPVNFNV